jgi:diguanylate cyclase (GGDEF)-like protein
VIAIDTINDPDQPTVPPRPTRRPRPSFTFRIAAVFGVLGLVALVTLAATGYQRIVDINSENSAIRIDRAARAATRLAEETTDGRMTVVVDDAGSPIRLDLGRVTDLVPSAEWDALVDDISAMNQGAANVFVVDDTTGAFDRISTSFKRPDGTRVGDSTREPGIITEGHPAYASISTGRPHTGPVPVMDRLRLAYLTPIFVDGEVGGALAVDVGWVDDLERINGETRSQVVIVTALFVVLAGLVATALSFGAFRPLRRLTAVADRLGRGERVTDVPMGERSDEIGALARGLAQVDHLQGELMHIAYHDELTGLANRFGLGRELDVRLDSATPCAVLQIDLDDFGAINESLGHGSGDRLLVDVADRLARLSPEAYVARSGGDDFTMVTGPLTDAAAAVALADQIVATVTASATATVRYPVTACVGITVVDRSTSSATALQQVEIALANAKRSGPSTSVVFQPDMAAAAERRVRLTADLREALADGSLRIDLQPQYDLRSGSLVGMEALARWTHPTEGPIPPPEFIHLAETSGMVTELGARVLDLGCAFARRWRDAERPSIVVSVNVSPIQLWSTDLLETVAGALERHDLPGEALCLEITESVLVDHADRDLLDLLDRLRGLGIRISIDDFGTGYSALSYLHAMPIDELKIDRSFIVGALADRKQADVAASIVDLGHALGFTVIAEGIEDDEARMFVERIGCEHGQGYLFSRPVHPDTAIEATATISG